MFYDTSLFILLLVKRKFMASILVSLDQLIESNRKEYYSSLRPGLDDATIQILENRYGITLPEDLKNLYKWHDGQRYDNYEAFVNNCTFLQLDQALDSAAEFTSMIGSDFELPDMWHETWIPIFSNGGGDFICYDLAGSFDGQAGQLIEYWHADNDRNIIAGNLSSFLQALVELYQMYDPVDEYLQVEDLPGYPVRHVIG